MPILQSKLKKLRAFKDFGVILEVLIPISCKSCSNALTVSEHIFIRGPPILQYSSAKAVTLQQSGL